MVHGNPTWSFFYRRLISLLAANHRVIALDNLGCGLSDKPQNHTYRLQQHIDNLSSLLSTLEIEKYSLVVHDWGGAIGLGCALQDIERLERVVVMNTAAFRSKRIPFRIQICRWPVIGNILVRCFNGFARPAVTMAVTNPLPQEVAKAYLAPYDTYANRAAIYGFVRDIPMNPQHPSYATLVTVEERLVDLQQSGIPMLLLWGGKDFCFNDSFYNEWCTRFPKAKKHYLSQAGHYLLEDGWDTLKPLFEDFFARNSKSRGETGT